MRPNPLDDGSTDRLLAGAVNAEDVAPDYSAVAHLFDQARQLPAASGERETVTIVAMRSAIETQPMPESQRKSMLTKLFTVKAVAIAGVIALSATGAAAATGSLPRPAQRTASNTLAHVGINVPAADGRADDRGGDRARADDRTENSTDDPATTATTTVRNPSEHATVTTVPHPGEDNRGRGSDSDNRGPGNSDDRTPTTLGNTPTSTPGTTSVTAPEHEAGDDSGHHGGGESEDTDDHGGSGRN